MQGMPGIGQRKSFSIVSQLAEQPSPDTSFPSSQASPRPGSSLPFPQPTTQPAGSAHASAAGGRSGEASNWPPGPASGTNRSPDGATSLADGAPASVPTSGL